ncbi:class I adenylate-forming enzyme family protein [Thalassobacillus hwangdonensis]|uniref:Class I adenylate-forming enzyme family protein n=1 Tax=Thalassobacillus hwangdonensis TaxID=546108 RepID=A0ABW3L335_9BACI
MMDSILNTFPKEVSEQFPEKTALYFYGEEVSYREWDALTGRLARGLEEKFGVQAGDVIAIQTTNTIEFVYVLFACWKLGAALTPINPSLKPEEIRYQLEHSNAKCYFYQDDIEQKANEATHQLEIVSIRVSGDKQKEGWSLQDVLSENELNARKVSNEAIGLIIYTSGTTGKPKGVLLSHSNIIEMCNMSIKALQLTEEDRSFLILPLFHVNAIIFTLTSVLMQGGSVVIRKRFVTDEFLPAVDLYKPTFTSGVPTVYRYLAGLPEGIEHNYDISSMRFGICGAAPVSTSLFEQFETRFPFKLIEGWGLSEGTCASTLNPLDGKRKVGSIGKPLDQQSLKIVNEEREEVPIGEYGELMVKGPNVMQGYFRNEAETKNVLQDGWLSTGDIGYQDEEGFFYIVDRKKDMIIRGGMNIYPKQIEEVISQLPDVLETAVIGIPDELYGEEVVAYVVLKGNSQLTSAKIMEHCQTQMANYRCPKQVYVTDEIPKNSVGKVTKGELRDLHSKVNNR